jgi:hypothetical protein
LRDFVKFAGLKKPAAARIPLRQRPSALETPSSRATTNNTSTPTRGNRNANTGTPTRGNRNADSCSDHGDDGHYDDNDNDSNTPITGKEYSQHQFWNYVDDYMDFIQTTLFKDTTDAVAHRGKVLWYGITIISSYLLCLSFA